jgi:putative FmdB family regulatory protein
VPTYEYECRSCGRRMEIRQSMADAPLTECAECGGEIRRVISGGSGFHMKAGGGHGEGCSLERGGKTCCGREERCGKPPCGGIEG